jgi:phage tail sheath protein FI
MQSRKAKGLMKKRQSTVEPVIGTLVNYLGMKRVNTRGLMQANKCMTMAAVAYNLKKLLKHSANNVIANLQALKQAGRTNFYFALSTFFSQAMGVEQLVVFS